jgi:hypothetical protein
MADYTFNPVERNEAPKTTETRSSREKYRIRNVFESTIVLDELSLRQTNPNGKGQKVENYVSLEFPLIKINDYIVDKSEIDYFKIDSMERVPTITLTLSFGNDLFLTKNLPKDGDIISVAISNRSELLKPIRNDYVITGTSSLRKSTTIKEANTITIFGTLFIPGFSGYKGNASFNMTSMNALKEISKRLGLGFNTNEDGDTDDRQIWFVMTAYDKSIAEIAERSWKDENSFFDWWIDVYYNLNFVNVQKQLLSSEDDVDTAALIGNVNKEYYWGKSENNTQETPKVFSNFINFKASSFFISDWKPINKSSQITFDYGTSIQAAFFEHNNILYRHPEKQKYWDLKIEPAYDPDKVNSHILLRGRAKWDPSLHSDEPARANYDYLDLYNVSPWLGIQYTISNPDDDNSKWTGNHHRNYIRSQIQNMMNLIELEKLNVEINVQGTNLNVIRGDKIPIVLIQKDRVENLLVDKSFFTSEVVEFFYSGWYYVNGFTLSWMRDDPKLFSNFSQSFTLTRREWPAPIPVEPVKKNATATS